MLVPLASLSTEEIVRKFISILKKNWVTVRFLNYSIE